MPGKSLRSLATIFCSMVFVFSIHGTAQAASTGISSGLQWLSSSQTITGNWPGVETSEYYSTAHAVDALHALAPASPAYASGLQWMSSQIVSPTDYLSRRVNLLGRAGVNVSAELEALLLYRNPYGGWGGDAGYNDDILDTILALQALRAVNYTNSSVLGQALGYIVANQNSDNGWGFYSGDTSNAYTTALVLKTFVQYQTAFNIQSSLTRAVSYLLTKQNSDGGFGSSPSTVYETSLAFQALLESGQGSLPVLQNAINYLASTQAADGSWNEDAFSTALALQALANVKPNLNVTAAGISHTPAVSTVNDLVTIAVTVRNTGLENAAEIPVNFYDGDPATAGALIAQTVIAALPAGATGTASVAWTPTTTGIHNIFVLVDPAGTISEASKSDNKAVADIRIYEKIDLAVQEIGFTPELAAPGQAVNVQVKFANLGGIPAQNVNIRLSVDGVTVSDKPIEAVNSLEVQTLTFTLQNPSVGIHQVTAAADPDNLIIESKRSNNVLSRPLEIKNRIDLVVGSTSIYFSNSKPKDGETIYLAAVVYNEQQNDASTVLVRFYDGNPAAGGTQIGADQVISSISAASGAATDWVPYATLGKSGSHSIHLVADPLNTIDETDELNNVAIAPLTISGRADLIVQDIQFTPISPEEGDAVQIRAVVKNIGSLQSPAAKLVFVLGDASSGGQQIGIDVSAGAINPGAVSTLSPISFNTADHQGDNVISAVIDRTNVVEEIDETNNMLSKTVTVRASTRPDFTLSGPDITFIPAQPITGETVTISAQVHNLRDTAASNIMINFYDGDPAAGGILLGGTAIPALAGMGTAQAALPWSLAGITGKHTVYVKVDPGSAIAETNETNNMASSVVKVRLPQSAAPVNLTAVPATETAVDLAWEPGPDANAFGIAGYNVYRNGVWANSFREIAKAGTASASSSYSTYTADKAIDGNVNTFWYVNYNAPAPQWWSESFSSAHTVKKVVVYWSTPYYAKNFEVQTWDGTQWITMSTVTGNTREITVHEFSPPVTTDQVRIYITTGNYPAYVGIIREVKIYEDRMGAATAYQDAGLGAGAYTYAVTAVDPDGVESLPSNTASTSVGDTTPPAAPTGLTAGVSGFAVNVNWSANTEPDLAGYRLYRDNLNIALRTRGAWATGTNGYSHDSMIDGNASSQGYTQWDTSPQGSTTVSLAKTYTVNKIRMQLYDPGDSRFYRYIIESSVDGRTWQLLVDRSSGEWRGWQELTLAEPLQVKYFRITGTFASADSYFRVNEFEAYTPELASKTLDTYSGFGLSVSNYANFYEWSYDWNAGTKQPRRFVFSGFNLEDKDVLSIYDKDTNLLLGSYTGNQGSFSTPLLTAANYRFQFISDYEGTAPGFTMAGYVTPGNQTTRTSSETIYQNSSYLYAVTGIDTNGNEGALSDIATAVIADAAAPAVPKNLMGTGGNGIVNLSWTANSEADLAGYNLYRDTDTVPLNGDKLITGIKYADRTVTNLTAYLYTVTAVDINGNESQKSLSISITPSGIDLIGTLSFSTFPAQKNDSVELLALIKNQGNQDGTGEFMVSFYNGNPSAGGVLISTRVIPGIAQGNSAIAAVSWVPTAFQADIYVVIDPDNVVKEYNEANNSVSAKLVAFDNLKTLHTTYVYTLKDLVPFAYRNNNQIAVFAADKTLFWAGILQNGEHTVLSPGAGIYKVYGSEPYTVLSGDPVSGLVMGYQAIDEKNMGLSKNFYTYMVQFWGSDCKFVVFAYEDDTQVQVINSATNAVIWTGTLNKGEHYANSSATDVSGKFLRVTSTKAVSALTYTDQGYYIPSENGTFYGNLFYTYAGLVGGWPEDINVIAFENNTNAIIRNTTNGQILWQGSLNEGEVHSEHIEGYYTVESDKKVTAGVFPFKSYTGAYYHMAVPYDPTGTGVGRLFYAPAISGGALHVFSYEDGNIVTITNWKTKTVAWSGTLNAGEFKKIDTTYTVYKIQSTGNTSAIESYGDMAGADFIPTYYAAVTDLEAYKLQMQPETVFPGDNTLITATVSNRGDTYQANISVDIYVDDTRISTSALSLEPLSSADVQVNWQATEGTHVIKLVVDQQDLIPEQNELNNTVSVGKTISYPEPPALVPDLTISSQDVTFSNDLPRKGETVIINAGIRNAGTDAANITVFTYLGDPRNGGTQIGSATIPSIAAGGIGTIQTQWPVDKAAGAYDIYLWVDPFDAIHEMDKTNNIAYKILVVSEKQISLTTATDKTQYAPNSDVAITVSVANNSALSAWSGTGNIIIEDQAGNIVAPVTSFTVTGLKPTGLSGWGYRLSATVTAGWDMRDALAGTNIDFAAVLDTLGLISKTIDKDSLRVLELDGAGNIVGEKQAKSVFRTDSNAEVTWLMNGPTALGVTRYFSIYFDTTDHGSKTPSLNTKLPQTGRLIAYSDDTGNLFVVESNGGGTFGTPRLVEDVTTAYDYTRGVVLHDFNNDGFLDIVTGTGSTGDIYYYQNKADGTNTFAPKVKIGTITANSYIMDMTAADFNKDGNMDFVVSGNMYNQLSLFQGNGDGTFTQSNLAVPAGTNYFRGKTAADVDGDGNMDLIVATNGASLYLYRGNGDGTFKAPVQISTAGSDSYGLVSSDFNGDGKIDLILNRSSLGDAYFLAGNGDGTFGAAVLVPSLDTNNYTAFDTGDFNNDGLADVIAATYTSRNIEFYPGKGDGTFGAKTIIATTASTYPLGISASAALPEVHSTLTGSEPVPVQTVTAVWNTGTTQQGNYKVHATLAEGAGIIADSAAPFAILPDTRIDSKVTTDKISYDPRETAIIYSTVTSLSVNTIFSNLTAQVTIQGADGLALFTETKPISLLMPAASISFKSFWNTGATAAGNYPVRLEVRDVSGALLSASTGTVTINGTVRPSKLLKGQISVDRQSVLSGEPVNVSYSVTNVGNVDLSDIALSVATVNVSEQATYGTITDQASIAMGATVPKSGVFDTTNYPAKDYLVILKASIGGVEEKLASTYFRVEGAPSAPALFAPANGSDVYTYTPTLVVSNAADPNDDTLTYEFELYSDVGLSNLIAASGVVSQGTGTTSWTVPADLLENAHYFWRARAYDGKLYGPWMNTASFRINTVNEPPAPPVPTSPADGMSVSILAPMLVVMNAADPDSTGLTYNFDLALDPGFTQVVASTRGISEGQGTTSWQVPLNLQENTWYYWRAQADDWLVEGPWSATVRFFVNTTNEAPTAPVIIAPVTGATVPALAVDITATNSNDPDSAVLSYSFELDKATTFDSPALMASGRVPEGQGTTTWNTPRLEDNTLYYVRVKASDGIAESAWSTVVWFFTNTVNDPPTTPILANPSNGAGVNVLSPTLSVYDSTDPDRDVLTYEFELYSDAALTTRVTSTAGVAETAQITSWSVSVELAENRTYYWRARASDGALTNGWMPAASFMVNTANDAPGAPKLSSPADGSSVATLTPTLAIVNAVDPDSSSLTYEFEIYAGGSLVASLAGVAENASGITAIETGTILADNTAYQWRARAFDGDQYGPWMTMASFTVHLPKTSINATINFDPDTLNKTSKGTWVTVYIELPDGYNVADIEVASIRLEGSVPAELRPSAAGDHDKDGIRDLMVKFKRSEVIGILPLGEKVPVHVTGKVGSITFDGVDIIRVIECPGP